MFVEMLKYRDNGALGVASSCIFMFEINESSRISRFDRWMREKLKHFGFRGRVSRRVVRSARFFKILDVHNNLHDANLAGERKAEGLSLAWSVTPMTLPIHP